MVGQLLFIVILVATAWFAGRKYSALWQNVHLGRHVDIPGDRAFRLRNLLLVAFGQSKMFKKPLPAVLHAFIYVAFLFTQVELVEILLDGVTGHHRMFAPFLGGFYTLIISLIEILSLLAFIATVAFLARRNILNIKRFDKPELKGWPSRDANLILLGEILLIIGIFTMNGADLLLQDRLPDQYKATGEFLISGKLAAELWGDLETGTLILLERAGWWLHLVVVFGFFVYLPFSKHLHIILAFPNTWFSPQTPRGRMENMPEIMQEVRAMMGLGEASSMSEIPEFGASDVTSLSWKNILDAYACTECGRCTASCPANLTGKKLSPRKVMMDIRDRAEEVGALIRTGDKSLIRDDLRSQDAVLSKENFSDGKSLFDRISPEEIHACTTCNACVEACPVMINPLEPILKLRRYEILTQSAGPTEWLPLFNSLENSGSAWQVSTDREQWVKDTQGF